MNAAIQIKDLSVILKGKDVLKKINMTLSDGLFLGIVGPNGGGKTTLIRTILGLIKPSAGTVKIFGQEPESLHGKEPLFGYLPQHLTIDPNFPANAFDTKTGVVLGVLTSNSVWEMPADFRNGRSELLGSNMAISAAGAASCSLANTSKGN